MKGILLTLLQLYIGGFSFTLPNGFPSGQNLLPSNMMNALPNGFPKGIFNGMPNGVMTVPANVRRSLPTLNVVNANSSQGQQNSSCCFGETCLSPCPFAAGGLMPMPMMPVMPMPAPAPVIVPARTYFEPVVHEHPPIHKIREIMRRDRGRERKRKRNRVRVSSEDCSGSDGGSSDNSDSRIDYYDDVINVKV